MSLCENAWAGADDRQPIGLDVTLIKRFPVSTSFGSADIVFVIFVRFGGKVSRSSNILDNWFEFITFFP